MKLLHLSDLHIGKRIYERSMLGDQKEILEEILNLAKREKPDGILIAGDIYDKSIPQESSVLLLDYFLTELNRLNISVFIVSGNHDSSERIQFGRNIMRNNEIYISGLFTGQMEKFVLQDQYGSVNIYLLPFVKPAIVKRYYEVETYHEAVQAVIEHTKLNLDERNILVAHQFVTNGSWIPQQCESETIFVGGLDQVDCKIFGAFDYVALGHLHGAQKVGSDFIRYAGSPLKYSFSEALHKKSVTMLTLEKKGEKKIQLLPLIPKREMRELKGPLEELIKPQNYTKGDCEDYLRITLTDEEELYAPMDVLRNVYPNILRLDFENSRTLENEKRECDTETLEKKTNMELFEDFYMVQNGVCMTNQQRKVIEIILNNR